MEPLDRLKEIATINKWLCKYDCYEVENKEENDETTEESDDDNSSSEYKWKLKYEELERKYNKLKKRLSLDD